MMNQLMYNDRQEWIIRVGCLFIVIGIHLWLLLFSQVDFSLSGQSALANINNAGARENTSTSLSVSFVSATPKKQKQPQPQPFSSRSIEKKASNEKLAAVRPAERKVAKEAKTASKKIQEKLPKETDKTTPLVNDMRINNALAREQSTKKLPPSQMQDVKEKALEKRDVQSEIAKQEKIIPNKAIDYAKEVIIYKPQLAAPPIPPKYPNVARRKKQQGTVWLDILVDKRGKQQNLNVYKSSGVPVLDKAAITAVKQWQFAHLKQSYHAQQIKIRIPIEFSLN